MPSTYTVNLGIEKPATGEQSGTWGDTTNVNFDILDQAINGAERVTLTSAGSSGSPNALQITNGATSDGRNKWLEFYSASDLGGSAFVQLDPNDAEKIVFVRNSLAGSQSLILFQGTYNAARDLEVPAGVDMVVKFDGGGASAATVTDVYNKLRVTELTTPTLTATTADINGGTLDNSVIGGTTAAAITGTTITANTSLNIAGDGATVTGIKDEDDMSSNSPTKLATQQSIKAYVDSQVGTVDTLAEILANGNTSGANNLIIDNGQALTSNTINETTAGSGVTIDSVLLKDDVVNATDVETSNISANDGTAAASIANSTGNFTITNFISNSVDIGGGAIDGTVIGGASAAAGSFTTLDASGAFTGTTATLTTADNNPQLTLISTDADASVGPILKLYRNSASPADNDAVGRLLFTGEDDAGNEATYARIETIATDVSNGSENAKMEFYVAINDTFNPSLTLEDTGAATFSSTLTTGGDFLAESSASIDSTVRATGNNTRALGNYQAHTSAGADINMTLGVFGDASRGEISTATNHTLRLYVNNTPSKYLEIGTTGQVFTSYGMIVNEDSNDSDFRVESNGNTHAIFVDASSDRVAILDSTPVSAVDIVTGDGSPADSGSFLSIKSGTGNLVEKLNLGVNSTSGYAFIAAVRPGISTRELRIQPNGGGTTFNDDGNDQDFRIESDSNTHMLFVDGGNNRVGINASTPENPLHVNDTSASSQILVQGDSNDASIKFNRSGQTFVIGIDATDNGFKISDDPTLGTTDRLRIASSGAATFTNSLEADSYGFTQNSAATGIQDAIFRSTTGRIEIRAGNVDDMLVIDGTNGVIANDGGVDRDFRVESDGNANMLFVDAGNNRVGVGLSNPQQHFSVQQAAAGQIGSFYDTGTNGDAMYNGAAVLGVSRTSDGSTSLNGPIFEVGRDNDLTSTFNISKSLFTVRSDATVVNDDSEDYDFRVESDNYSNMLTVDAGTNRVGIRTSPAYLLHVDAAGVEEDIPLRVDGYKTGVQQIWLNNERAPYLTNGRGTQLIFGNNGTIGGYISATGYGSLGNGELAMGIMRSGGAGTLQTVLSANSNTNHTILRAVGAASSSIFLQSPDGAAEFLKLNTTESVFNEGSADQDFRVESDSETHMLFVDASTNQVYIGASSGSFGAHLTIENNASYTIESVRTGTGSEGHVAFRNANGAVGTIFTNGTTTSYNTSSDARLKESIADAEDAGAKVDAIQVRQFDWKADGAHQDYGMIAQELMTVAPEAVTGDPESDDMMGVDYSKLVPMLVKEIQSLRARVAQLENT